MRDNVSGRFQPVVPRDLLLDHVNAVLAQSAVPLRVGEIHQEIEKSGGPSIPLGTFRDHVRVAIKTDRILRQQIIDGRLDNRGTSVTRRRKPYFKFKVGDKVRVNAAAVPQWLRHLVRTDTPRTIVQVCRTDWRAAVRHTRYYLGSNRLGDSRIASYPFQPGELIPYVPRGKVGRPRTKRQYTKRTGENRRGDSYSIAAATAMTSASTTVDLEHHQAFYS